MEGSEIDSIWREIYLPQGIKTSDAQKQAAHTNGYKIVEINGHPINIPVGVYNDLRAIDYIQFASRALPRSNPDIQLNQDITDKAWNVLLVHITRQTGRAIYKEALKQVCVCTQV